MKQNNQPHTTGIRIENTLSMAVQNRNHVRNSLHLFVLAVCGALSSIWTFLSMFQPQCHLPVLIGFLTAEFAGCALLAHYSGKLAGVRTALLAAYALLLYLFRKAFSIGFVHLINTICKVIYMTEWERFAVSDELPQTYCVTVFLIFIFLPILYMLCYAVLHFQNLFLSLIATFPFVEIGFYFGVPANRFAAMLLLAFWFSMAAVHLSNSGTYHGKGQNSFLRRENTFFPVSSMRFMVTEQTGIRMLAGIMALCLVIQQVVYLTGYQRSEEVKVLRRNMQKCIASLMAGDFEGSADLWQNLLTNKPENDRLVVTLGDEEKREFDEITLSGLTLSELPEGRIYLKHRIGEVYTDNSWCLPEESVYDADVFRVFDTLNYYPQEFLYWHFYPTGGEDITVTFHNVTDTLSKCVPYGFREQEDLQCLRDNRFSAFAPSYRIVQNQDFEAVLLNTGQEWLMPDQVQYQNCRPQNWDTFRDLFDYENLPALSVTSMNESAGNVTAPMLEAALLCRYGYKDYVTQLDLQVPDTQAMRNVRERYSFMLDSFSGYTASASETIAFMQELRETVCRDMVYTLAPGRTPPTEDFVEFFLLKNQKGYCMHYASAGVLLARMAGIPARYCEGYMVDPAEMPLLQKIELDGEEVYSMEILDSNAHAWIELYIDGWGWIPFEFTFTEASQPLVPETEPATEPVIETVTSIVTSYVQPTMEPETAQETISGLPAQPPAAGNGSLRLVLYVLGVFLLIGLIVGAFHFLRVLAIRRRNALFCQTDTTKAVGCIYEYICRLLAFCGADMSPQSTAQAAENASAVCGNYLKEWSFEDVVNIAAKAKYSRHTISEEEVRLMRQTAKLLAMGIDRDASRSKRFRLRYILHLV